jgi:hypothetical protein
MGTPPDRDVPILIYEGLGREKRAVIFSKMDIST